MSDEKSFLALEKKRLWKEKVKKYKQYRKGDIVDALHGVVKLPKKDIGAVFDAICELLVDLASEESVVYLPRVGKFIFEPKHVRRIWNPKEQKSLFYQNPKVSFRVADKLRNLLRRQHRKNCYQLMELNKLTASDFKPPLKMSRLKEEL